MMKRAVAFFLLIAIAFSSNMNVFASDKRDETSYEYAVELVNAIESELNKNGSSVVHELDEMILEYQKLIENSDDEEYVSRVLMCIHETSLLRANYCSIMEQSNHFSKGNRGNEVYYAAVATITAWFNSNGYSLASELLSHAASNTVLDSQYSPIYASRVKASQVFYNIAYGTTTSGTNSFPNSGNTYTKDLYYAIHAFHFYKSSSSSYTVTIYDRYDFNAENYTSIAGVAISVMQAAQSAGVLTPFYSWIVQTAES